MLRHWRSLWDTSVLITQHYPSWFVELLMVTLASILLLCWGSTKAWPYLMLSLSYAIGCAASILVRESVTPSYHPNLHRFMALLLLLFSLYGFNDLLGYF